MIELTTANRALKDVYLGVVSNLLNETTDVLLSKITPTTNDVYGNQICKCVNIDGKTLNLKEELETLSAGIEISYKAIRVSQNSAGAFVNLLNSEIENMIKDAQRRIRNSFYTEDVKPEYLPDKIDYKPLNIVGLKKLFDTKGESLYGLKRKEEPAMNPIIKKIKTFNPIRIQEIIDNNNENVNVLVCSAKIKREYMDYLSKHRQEIEIFDMSGGFKCIKFNNLLLMVVAKIPDNEIYLLNTADFKFHQLCDWQWIEDERGNVIRLSSEDVYRATLVKYGNYICEKPHKQIKIIIGE